MIAFYPAKNNNMLNGQPFEPERVAGGRAMVNPYYPVAVAAGDVVCDSGAFQDCKERVTAAQAIDRQLAYERSMTRAGRRRFPRGFEALVTYDQLVGVDEAIVDGKRVKRRGTEESAAAAVAETIAAAELYHRERYRVAGAVAYAAQGATLRQYLACVRAILDLADPARDWLALGGFCIIGMVPSLKPLFGAVCREVAPLARRAGIRRVHILGVCVTDALALAAAVFRAAGIEVSTDSSSIERNAINGGVWSVEYMASGSPWRQVYGPGDKGTRYRPAELAHANIARFTAWCASPPALPPTRVRVLCDDGTGDGCDWVWITVPAHASLDVILGAADEAGIRADEVLRVQTPDGLYELGEGGPHFESWSRLRRFDRAPKLWRYVRSNMSKEAA